MVYGLSVFIEEGDMCNQILSSGFLKILMYAWSYVVHINFIDIIYNL